MMIQILYTFANQAQQKQIHFKEFMFNAFNLNTCDFFIINLWSFTYSLSHWQHIWRTYLGTIFSSLYFSLKFKVRKTLRCLAKCGRDKSIDIRPHCNIVYTLSKP